MNQKPRPKRSKICRGCHRRQSGTISSSYRKSRRRSLQRLYGHDRYEYGRNFWARGRTKGILNRFIDIVAGIFTPIINVLMAAGMIKGLLCFIDNI